MALARAARSFQTNAGRGLRGGRDPKASYLLKHFARMFLAVVEVRMPEIWDTLQIGELTEYLPDTGTHTLPLAGMNMAAARLAFDVPITMLSMWACLAHSVAEKRLKATLAADLPALAQHFHARADVYDDDGDGFSMGPRALLDAWQDAGLL